jgi:dTDP-4-amino-4,6-dideoxygalactose transaminase
MDALRASAERHGLAIVEDAAQAMGTRHRNRRAGALGTVGCFSAHPLKIFNALGDSGFITTDSDDIAARVRLLRNHGLVDRDTVAEFGYVSRLDALQAVVLRYRLNRLDTLIERRRANARLYRDFLAGVPIELPNDKPYEYHTFVNFVSQCDRRDELQKASRRQRRADRRALQHPDPFATRSTTPGRAPRSISSDRAPVEPDTRITRKSVAFVRRHPVC